MVYELKALHFDARFDPQRKALSIRVVLHPDLPCPTGALASVTPFCQCSRGERNEMADVWPRRLWRSRPPIPWRVESRGAGPEGRYSNLAVCWASSSSSSDGDEAPLIYQRLNREAGLSIAARCQV